MDGALMANNPTLDVLAEIEQPDFDAALPPLSDDSWLRILAISRLQYEENERLEFVGDAVMYATIGRQLYSEIPTGTPGLYTVCRIPHSLANFFV